MMPIRRNVPSLLIVVLIVIVYVSFYNRHEVNKKLSILQTLFDTHRISTSSSSSSSAAAAAAASSLAVKSVGAGRRPDDGVWHNFSDPPSLLFYAYSAFADDRPLEPKHSDIKAVVRVIAVSTRYEHQQNNNVSLFCLCYYDNGLTAAVSRMHLPPSPIGMGWYLYGKAAREYVYACPLRYRDNWPTSLSIVTGAKLQTGSQPSRRMPVEVQLKPERKEPLAVCVHVAYGRIDPVRLIEWFEFQRILGVSLVGVYLLSNFSKSAERSFRHYSQVEGLVDLRRSEIIERFVGGSKTSHQQVHLHKSPVINDCLYRHMYSFRHVAVIDFDEVIVPRGNCTRLTDIVNELHRNYSSAAYVFRNNYFFTDLPPAHSEDTSNITFLRQRLKTSLSPHGYSVKSIIDPRTCVNMHHHYCWGFVYNTTKRNHDVDPDVAVLQHYKRCHFKPDKCRQMMNDARTDDTVLKYRTELIRVVSQKLSSVYK